VGTNKYGWGESVVVVVIVYKESHVRREAILSGIPREGENIRLRNGSDGTTLFVTQVIWEEAAQGQEPNVVCIVEPKQK